MNKKILYVMPEKLYSSLWRVKTIGNALIERGYTVDCFFLNIEIWSFLSWLPNIIKAIIIRLMQEVKALQILFIASDYNKIVFHGLYSSTWLTGCVDYVYDVVDFADTEDIIKLHHMSKLNTWKARHNYKNVIKFIKNADIICTNNFYCIELCKKLNKKTHLLIDPIKKDLIKHGLIEKNEFVIGWIGSEPTETYMAEYYKTLQNFKLDFMGCSKGLAKQLGDYVCRDWSMQSLQDVPQFWSVGISLMPSNINFYGKFAGKIVQYMAAGIPTIATHHGMTPYLIKDGVTGILVSNNEELLKALNYLKQNPKKAEKMGQRARQEFEKRFSLESQIDDYYKKIIK